MITNVHFHLTSDGIPILGGIFKTEKDAVNVVKDYIKLAKKKQNLQPKELGEDISLEFIRQIDRRFKLIVNFGDTIGYLEELANVDELMLWKFKKNLKKKRYFILTSFYTKDNQLLSTVFSQSLGLVIYKS